jgi:hypothetical protein
MAVVNLTATSRGDKTLTEGVTTRDGLNIFESTVEVGSDDSATSTYLMARVPGNIRLSNLSLLAFDDLASTGSPTLDVGTFGTNVTDNDDSINDGINVSSAASAGTRLIKDPANIGKYVWELAGESENPDGLIDITLTLKDAAVNVGGTVTLTLVYWVDNS